MTEHYLMFAGYNAWANERLYAAAEKLTDAEYNTDRGAFFKSVHGTLNHLLVGDRIWMQRLTGKGEAPARIDMILFDDLPALAAARRDEDARISDWIGALGKADLDRSFTYRTITNPATVTQPLAPALDHFSNHQTHHRGQAHCLLTAMRGQDLAPSLDLILFQRQTGQGGVKQQV